MSSGNKEFEFEFIPLALESGSLMLYCGVEYSLLLEDRCAQDFMDYPSPLSYTIVLHSTSKLHVDAHNIMSSQTSTIQSTSLASHSGVLNRIDSIDSGIWHWKVLTSHDAPDGFNRSTSHVKNLHYSLFYLIRYK